jgi:hypothetical protein
MAKKTKAQDVDDIEFGVRWNDHPTHKWPANAIRELTRRSTLARLGVGEVPRWRHRREIIQKLWPGFAWHEWSDRRLQSVCDHHFVMWMAGGGTGKTSDAAIAALEWWLEDPSSSAVIVCSTTKDMLRTRIWGEIVKYHSMLPVEAKVGELLDTACFIRIRDGDWKNGIKGIAVQDGPIEEAINNIVGMHTKRVWVILDEAQGVREAIMRAIPNLLKNPESRMLIMGNPNSFQSLLCRYGAPIDGWDSIPRFSEQWETKTHGYIGKGIGLFFDGRKSPAVLDPEWGKAHPWMLNQQQIDAHLSAVDGNENDPDFMCQTIGWPPSMGIESTVLDGATVNTFHCQRPAIWTHGKTACAALDPAFNGGDKAILQFGHRGWVEDDDGARWVIGYGDSIAIPLDAESERPIHYQILDYCKAQCEARGIPPNEFAVAAAGEGGGLVSIMREEWGPVIGIEEGGAPSDRKVGVMGKTAKESYDTRASELLFLLREFALGNGVRGLPDKATEQAMKRQTFHRNSKWCAEPKSGSKGRTDAAGKALKGFKQRLGYSPDELDSCIILAEHCRLMGAEPGTGLQKPKSRSETARTQREIASMWNENNYTESEDFSQYANA